MNRRMSQLPEFNFTERGGAVGLRFESTFPEVLAESIRRSLWRRFYATSYDPERGTDALFAHMRTYVTTRLQDLLMRKAIEFIPGQGWMMRCMYALTTTADAKMPGYCGASADCVGTDGTPRCRGHKQLEDEAPPLFK